MLAVAAILSVILQKGRLFMYEVMLNYSLHLFIVQ